MGPSFNLPKLRCFLGPSTQSVYPIYRPLARVPFLGLVILPGTQCVYLVESLEVWRKPCASNLFSISLVNLLRIRISLPIRGYLSRRGEILNYDIATGWDPLAFSDSME